jgi:hypothetical protein
VLRPEPLGSYYYDKFGGTCHVLVYLLHVTDAATDWPERTLRERSWVSMERAVSRIEDHGLCEILQSVALEQARG